MKNTVLFICFILFYIFPIEDVIAHSVSFQQLPVTLPSNEVQNIYQDKDGFIWITTKNGLVQYDGYEIKTFKSNLYYPDLLTSNNVNCVVEDNKHNLWIGATGGLNILDKVTGKIKKANTNVFDNTRINCIVILEDNSSLIGAERGLYTYDLAKDTCYIPEWTKKFDDYPNDGIQSLFKDSKGHIWIGTWSNGLFRFDPNKNEFFKYYIDERNSAHHIYEDSRGRMWIGTWGRGLYKLENQYEMSDLKWTNYRNMTWDSYNSAEQVTTILDNIIYAISEDKENQVLWVGTRSGLCLLDISKDNDQFVNYKVGSRNDLPYNEVNAILRDRSGQMWLGMLGGGVYTVNTTKSQFELNRLNSVRAKFSTNSVRSIFSDSRNNLWMGVGSYGLVVYNQVTKTYSDYASIVKGTVSSIIQSPKTGRLYFGTDGFGIFYFDYKNTDDISSQEIKHLSAPGFNHSAIQSMMIDRSGNLWVCARNGFGFISQRDGKYYDVIPDIGTNKSFYSSIIEDAEGNIWVGTTNAGIIKVKKNKEGTIFNYDAYTKENKRLVINNIQCFFIDSSNRLWVGTEGGGLNLYDKEKNVFISVNKRFNILGDAVYSIEEDEKGFLWMGTGAGLVKLFVNSDLTPSTVRVYSKSDGLQDNLFIKGSSFRAKSGKMYFGGHKGYNSFYPAEIHDRDFATNLVVTDIKIFNQSITNLDQPTRDRISKAAPSFTKELVLSYKENNFSVEFAGLNYLNSSEIKYSYILEGFDTQWQYTDASRRFAYYNNLASGKYVFKLRSTNENGIWQREVIQIKVIVKPAPWLTWWAYTFYFIILCAFAVFIYKSIKNRLSLRESLRLKEIQQVKSEEVNHAKLQFFTNITHELMTPLTITSASLEELKIVAPEHKGHYSVMESNINRLIRLLQQILEFRKAETGNLKLKVLKGDLANFVTKGTQSFEPLMKKKKLHFSILCAPEVMPAYFDPDKMDKILYNLLSNAAKYNREGGFIHVDLSYGESKDEAVLSVKDNGQGLNKKDQKNLFKRFYEGDYRKFNTIGTGIGLSLVKDLVTLHRGQITVDSDEGAGTCFSVTIPISTSYYDQDQVDEETVYENLPVSGDVDVAHDLAETDQEADVEKDKTILILEDNEDLLKLMVRLLRYEYNILTAQNGKEGLVILENERVDMIVSDVMMPEMDGIEFCTAVKNNFEICHIPLILLTAKNTEEDRVIAYDSGADGFISKPFNLSVLHAKIKNLLKAKDRMVKDFKNQLIFDIKESNYTSIDEDFLKRAIECVHKFLDVPDFDQQQFSEAMGASKSTLYRKLKSLTGFNTSAFIRNIRLKAACQIIEEKNNIRISELAYAVGFNDPKYFSTCFKKEFGFQPSEYIERFTQEKLEEDVENEDDESEKQ